MIIKDLSFDIAEVHHDGIHHMKLSIEKDSNIRHTYCIKCGISKRWERVIKIEGLKNE